MFADFLIFEVIRLIFLWLSPILFGLGFLLIFYSNFQKLEAFLDREVGGSADKRKRIPGLEDNIYTFDRWLLKNKLLLGIVCVFASVAFYMILRT